MWWGLQNLVSEPGQEPKTLKVQANGPSVTHAIILFCWTHASYNLLDWQEESNEV